MTGPLCTVGESPVWRAADESLYWVDIAGRRLHRLHVPTGALAAWSTHEMPACLAFDAAGGLMAGMESGVFTLHLGDDGQARARRLAGVAHPVGGMRFNDGRCDRQGRFWAGTMHLDMAGAHAVGSLYRYTSRDGLVAFADGLVVQNGLAWSPDGSTMYLSDSHPAVRMVWAFDYDAGRGEPSRRRVFVDMNRHPGRPDGAAVDEDGCYWTCANDAGLVHRFTPEGRLDRSIEVPVAKPSMCAFGGAGLDTMYITTIRPGDPAMQQAEPDAGAVFAVRPGVRGVPETPFAAAA